MLKVSTPNLLTGFLCFLLCGFLGAGTMVSAQSASKKQKAPQTTNTITVEFVTVLATGKKDPGKPVVVDPKLKEYGWRWGKMNFDFDTYTFIAYSNRTGKLGTRLKFKLGGGYLSKINPSKDDTGRIRLETEIFRGDTSYIHTTYRLRNRATTMVAGFPAENGKYFFLIRASFAPD